jgi:hypothetical protein
LISPSLLLLLSSSFSHDDKIDDAGLGSACTLSSRRAGLFVSGLRRSDECVSSLARFPALKNKIKFKLCERKATGKADGASEPLDAL